MLSVHYLHDLSATYHVYEILLKILLTEKQCMIKYLS